MPIIIPSRSGKDSTDTMHLYTIEGWLYFINDVFFQGFTWLTILCLIARCLPYPAIRREAGKVNAAKNLLMPAAALMVMLSTALLLMDMYSNQPEYEEFVLVRHSLQFEYISFSGALLACFIMLSFFWSRPRNSWWLTVLCLFLLHTGWLIEKVASWQKDYLPSFWETERPGIGQTLLEILVFALLTAGIYWLLYVKKKNAKPSN